MAATSNVVAIIVYTHRYTKQLFFPIDYILYHYFPQNLSPIWLFVAANYYHTSDNHSAKILLKIWFVLK